jgi:hypothetical protein
MSFATAQSGGRVASTGIGDGLAVDATLEVAAVAIQHAAALARNTTAGKHCALVLNRGRDRVRTKDISAAIG